MLTDSGVNAMSDQQQASMLVADDAYAGSASFERFSATINDIFGCKYVIPAHQGRACEHLLAKVFVKPGSYVPMNFHFTTAKAHITTLGGKVIELVDEEAFIPKSTCQFKGNFNIPNLKKTIKEHKGNIAFVRAEAGTNLIGGQPISLDNYLEVSKICKENGLIFILDASLLQDNLYFVKTREDKYKGKSIEEIAKIFTSNCDLAYFSARKLGFARGGAIMTSNKKYYDLLAPLVPLYEGFLTYGGMSVKEIEAINVGLKETMDMDTISHGPEFINYMVTTLEKAGIPVVTPPGGLGCHLDAMKFCEHLPREQYRAGALAAAFYLISGIRGMERGTLSEERDEKGVEPLSSMELLRLALPRRVFTLSQVKYAIDRIIWLYKNRNLIGGLKWRQEPPTLRFFLGELDETTPWQENLIKAFKKDFPNGL
jgi:tryptophanase